MLCQLSYPGPHQAEVTGLPKTFWSNVQVDANGHWLWTGPVNARGEGTFERHPKSTHQLAYEDQVGPIPAGTRLAQMCRVCRCCNPTHAEPVITSRQVARAS